MTPNFNFIMMMIFFNLQVEILDDVNQKMYHIQDFVPFNSFFNLRPCNLTGKHMIYNLISFISLLLYASFLNHDFSCVLAFVAYAPASFLLLLFPSSSIIIHLFLYILLRISDIQLLNFVFMWYLSKYVCMCVEVLIMMSQIIP